MGPPRLATSPAFLAVYAFLVGGLIGAANSLTNGLPVGLLPRAQARVAVSLLFCPFGLGMCLGPVIAGALHDASGSYAVPLLYSAACLALASGAVGGGSLCVQIELGSEAAVHPGKAPSSSVAEPEAGVELPEVPVPLTKTRHPARV